MSEAQPRYMPGSVLYEPPQLTEDEVLQAYYDTFTHEPGYTVLRSLYEGIINAPMESVDDLGGVRVYQGIIKNMRAWEQRQRLYAQRGEGLPHGSNPPG